MKENQKNTTLHINQEALIDFLIIIFLTDVILVAEKTQEHLRECR